MHLVLGKCLGDQSLPRNSVSRITDHAQHYLNSVDCTVKPQLNQINEVQVTLFDPLLKSASSQYGCGKSSIP